MSAPRKSFRPEAEDQAALWAARLEGGQLNAADRAALEAWLALDPDHRTLLTEYCQFSADLEEQLPLLVAAGSVPLPATQTVRVERPRRRSRVWAFSAGLAAAAAIAIAFFMARPSTAVQNLATAVAQRQSLTLADGSEVELNARTALVVEQDRTGRHVRLVDGEAFFKVSKDKSRPFTIDTPCGSVRVTGTSFNVRAEAANSLEVTVVEGSVQVRPRSTGDVPAQTVYSIGPRDQLRAGAAGVSVVNLSVSGLENSLAWRNGKVVFEGVPLKDALERFARYHGRTITASEGAAKLRIGGQYSLDDLEGFLSAIEDVYGVRVTRELNGSIRVTLRTEG